MQIYDVSGCTADIIRPGTTLTTWLQQQKVKPFAVCNASLYDFDTREPVGTIFEKGELVHNAGNGYGYGVIEGKPIFDSPWVRHWDEYISGHNSPIQNGRYCPPTFRDDYVFYSLNKRIAVGEKEGKTVLVLDEGVTLKQFADHALGAGVITLVNLDGGASRFLYYNGLMVDNSIRTPYNALVFYKEKITSKPEEKPITEKPITEKPYCPYSEPKRNLFWGCSGEDVKWAQWMINQKGFHINVDGKFGIETFNAVWKFQSTWARFPDGIVGPNTRRELLK